MIPGYSPPDFDTQNFAQASSFNALLICEFFFTAFLVGYAFDCVPPRVRESLTIPAPDLIGKEEKDDAWYTNGYFGIDA